jgi:hypothetical protein
MTLIRVQAREGETLVNIDHIATIQPDPDGITASGTIFLVGGGYVTLRAEGDECARVLHRLSVTSSKVEIL